MKAIRIRRAHMAPTSTGDGRHCLHVLMLGVWKKVSFNGFRESYDDSDALVPVSDVWAYSLTGVLNFVELKSNRVLGVMSRENSVELLLSREGLLIELPGHLHVEPDKFRNPDSEVVFMKKWKKH